MPIKRNLPISDTHLRVRVECYIKSVNKNEVLLEKVNIIGEFRDERQQEILKTVDANSFSNQFRQKPVILKRNGIWGMVSSKAPSGISKTKYQEEVEKLLGFTEIQQVPPEPAQF